MNYAFLLSKEFDLHRNLTLNVYSGNLILRWQSQQNSISYWQNSTYWDTVLHLKNILWSFTIEL